MDKQAYFKLIGLNKKASDLFDLISRLNGRGQKGNHDPNFVSFKQDDPYRINNDKIDQTIQSQLKKYYAKLLAVAYKRATGKNLSEPQKHVNPRFNYIIGRAGGIDPKILNKLDDYDYRRLGGWQRNIKETLDPDLIEDAVDNYNWNGGKYKDMLTGKKKTGPYLELLRSE